MKLEVGFVVGLVSFSGTVGAKKKDKEGHGGLEFTFCTRRFKQLFSFNYLTWLRPLFQPFKFSFI